MSQLIVIVQREGCQSSKSHYFLLLLTTLPFSKIHPVEEFKLVAVELEHELTRAQHLHIHKHDSNNVFSVCFQTASNNSTGVAHILEHTALCGSQKFNVRDPFFKMLNRSMSTFMNAMTGKQEKASCQIYAN